MKAILNATLTALILTPAAAFALTLGDTIPLADVRMKNVDGQTVSIQQSAGEKGTLVAFTCNHCPFVIAWQERMVAIAKQSQKKGIGVIFINSNSPAVKAGDGFSGMQRLAKENNYTFAYVVDDGSTVANAFGATRTPEIFLFDAAGALVYHGAVDDNARNPERVQQHWLQDAVAALLTGKTSAIQETKSVGCSIKFY